MCAAPSGKDVVEIDVLFVVRVAHGQAPEFILCGGKLRWPVARLVNRAEDVRANKGRRARHRRD